MSAGARPGPPAAGKVPPHTGLPRSALPLPPEQIGLRLATQLAARLVRPLGHFDASACPLPPLSAESLAAMSAHPAFRVPVNRAAARALAPAAAGIDASVVERLGTSAPSRLAALLASQPVQAVQEAALLVGAAILHRQVVGLVLKTDRERVRAALGPRAFLVSTQEAPLLHASLAEIEPDAAKAEALAGPDAASGRERIVALGARALARFVASVEPALAAVFALRRPAGGGEMAPLGPGHCDHVVRLLRRRMDAWSPTIA